MTQHQNINHYYYEFLQIYGHFSKLLIFTFVALAFKTVSAFVHLTTNFFQISYHPYDWCLVTMLLSLVTSIYWVRLSLEVFESEKRQIVRVSWSSVRILVHSYRLGLAQITSLNTSTLVTIRDMLHLEQQQYSTVQPWGSLTDLYWQMTFTALKASATAQILLWRHALEFKI